MRLITAADIIKKPLTIIAGPRGAGKTNLALNLAIDLAATSKPVMLVDLDALSPDLRSSNYEDELAFGKVELITPPLADVTPGAPAPSPEVAAAFVHKGPVIFDVGGADVGATALSAYRDQLQQAARAGELSFYYVVNHNHDLTETAAQAATVAHEIEQTTSAAFTGIINNSHLREETDLACVAHGYVFGQEVAALLRLPLLATTLPNELALAARATPEFTAACTPAAPATTADFYPVTRLVLP